MIKKTKKTDKLQMLAFKRKDNNAGLEPVWYTKKKRELSEHSLIFLGHHHLGSSRDMLRNPTYCIP